MTIMNFVLKQMHKRWNKPRDPNAKPPKHALIRTEPLTQTIPEGLVEVNDKPVVRVRGRVLRYDAVYAESSPAPRPVAIYVHGGGLMMGDRKACPVFRWKLAQAGYLVYSIEYPLLSSMDAAGMYRAVMRSLAAVRRSMDEHGGDPDRVFLIAESAGAFASGVPTAALASPGLRTLYHLPDVDLHLRGVLYISGMFYLTRFDPIGLIYKKDTFGSHLKDADFMKYVVPDDPAVMALLPPVLLTTSAGDFLQSYTLRFERALTRVRHSHELICYGDKELSHAFPSLMPSLPESGEVLTEMLDWMTSQ